MEIELKVELLHSTMKLYCIYYRKKKKFNLFNYWKRLVRVWDSVYLDFDQPVLFEDFDKAVEYAKKLKSNPKLIEEHYKKERIKYNEAKKRKNVYYQKRNRFIKI